MQKLYQIIVTPCHKPWRGQHSVYITDKQLFGALEDGDFLPTKDLPENYQEEYDGECVTWENLLYKLDGEIIFPIEILDSKMVYCE
jgi:hypothetical protein